MSQFFIIPNGGTSGPFVATITGNDSIAVPPTAGGNWNLLGAGAVTVTGNIGTNTSTISINGSGVTWQTISASQTLVVNNGYMCIAPGGALTLALPATATIGNIIEITLDGATSWQITQAAGQQIRIANSTTTLGAGGSITTTAAGDSIRLVAQSATRWNAVSFVGNLTVI